MGSVVYCKSTGDRRKKFQVYTRILREGERLRVEKENVYPEGQEHILSIAANHALLGDLYRDFSVCPCHLEGNVAHFPFAGGETLERRLTEAAESGNGLETLMTLWRKIVIGREGNLVPFSPTPGFLSVFGEPPVPAGAPALKVANLDANADNIFLDGDSVTLIDCEWVFRFPVPLDYALYRVVCDTWRTSRRLTGLLPLDRLLHLAGVAADRTLLERMDLAFARYVGVEEDTGVSPGTLGLRYRTRPADASCAHVYFDQGAGFSDGDRESATPGEDGAVFWKKQVGPGLRRLRFDPVEGLPCAVRGLKVLLEGREARAVPVNGWELQVATLFGGSDPQYLIRLPRHFRGTVELFAHVEPLRGGTASELAAELLALQKSPGRWARAFLKRLFSFADCKASNARARLRRSHGGLQRP